MALSSTLLLFTSLALSLLPTVSAVRHYEIINNCPLSTNLYISGVLEGTLATGSVSTRDFPNDWSGNIYTDLNRGNPDSAGTVQAVFVGSSNYYYLLADPNWKNVGVSIAPINRAPKGGYCFNIQCLVNDCPATSAFTWPPVSFPPPSSSVPPDQPLYACPVSDTGYRVTFCPDGTLPNYQTGPNTIQPVSSTAKCLDVQGGVFANGTPVQIYDCNGTQAQKWDIRRGGGKIRVSGTNFCLDAGSTPGNGVQMKIWECFDNLPAQQWIYTSDNTIRFAAITNLCLDLPNGVLTNGNRIQTWTCSQLYNPNQVWTI